VGTKILVVDDDPTVSDVVRRYLQRSGHDVVLASDGRTALGECERVRFDLVVLDLMLPQIDGLEVCRRLRAGPHPPPIIMLTALGDEFDRITGLELGAEDYVTKPFSPRELVLRAQAVLRRTTPHTANDQLVDGDLVIDRARRAARRGGAELALTVREYDLLVYFMTHPGVVFRRAELLDAVWGWVVGDQSTVTVHVRRLREKIEHDPATPTRIQTVWGVGYRYELEPTGA
jgi:DNA-binding response OmpR family regulator